MKPKKRNFHAQVLWVSSKFLQEPKSASHFKASQLLHVLIENDCSVGRILHRNPETKRVGQPETKRDRESERKDSEPERERERERERESRH